MAMDLQCIVATAGYIVPLASSPREELTYVTAMVQSDYWNAPSTLTLTHFPPQITMSIQHHFSQPYACLPPQPKPLHDHAYVVSSVTADTGKDTLYKREKLMRQGQHNSETKVTPLI